ncbi:MAG TPA: NAD-dependent deacylase [Tepidisphaeraceae bacterium]|nr:NAD-dependent deacylase [Tepidisphaeraceae bacterium]
MLDPITNSLRISRSLVILTGAGVSAESGIPTFRDALTGLWTRFNPEDLATPQAFQHDPELVSRWYDDRRLQCANCSPNPGHHALAQLEDHFTKTNRDFLLLTQNVDRLHHRAGSKRIKELHGSLFLWRCLDCAEEREELGGPFPDHPPICPCGGPRRPAVVWFGELLPADVLDSAHAALKTCDTFMSLGTSAVVEPSASFIHQAAAHGAKTIEINLHPTPISELVDYSLLGKTGEILPQILARLTA